MKFIPMLAAAALIFGVTAASAQTPSSGANQPGATSNTDKEVPATGAPANRNMGAGSGGATGGTMGAGSSATGTTGGTTGAGSSATGTTGGSNPNPTSNTNPDKEVPGKKQ